MSWRGMITLLLLLGAAVSGWALWSQRDKQQPRARVESRPDYVLSDFELVALDEQGKEAFTLRAPRLERDPEAKTMDIVTPLLLIPAKADAKSGPWQIRAQTGWVSAKGEELRLRGQVTADSTNTDGQPIHMATEELNVFPDEKRATSAVAVSVTQPGTIMKGRGLEADLRSNLVTFKSDVKVRYESTVR